MKKQTQSRQYGYVSPKCKSIRLEQNVGFCASGNSSLYGGVNNAGIDMEDDDRYNYEF